MKKSIFMIESFLLSHRKKKIKGKSVFLIVFIIDQGSRLRKVGKDRFCILGYNIKKSYKKIHSLI